MVQISTEGMEVAPLTDKQLENLLEAEKNMNNNSTTKAGEVYLLAMTRRA